MTKRVFQLAWREAFALGDNRIRTEHVLLGLAAEEEAGAARILHDLGVDHARVRDAVIRLQVAGAPAGQSGGQPAHIAIPCPACGRTMERLELTSREGDVFAAERSGPAQCWHCGSRFELGYRIEWKPGNRGQAP